tara:strand:- start:4067 stop:4486 length:420 start_codon:yes stop_codon:yes gene_type:complete
MPNPFLENKIMDKVSNDFVGQLLESNGWEKLGIRVDEGKKTGGGPAVEGAKEVGKSAYDNENNSPEGITEDNCCPLCESDFGEYELTDEALQEHALNMMEVFSESGLISEQVEESFIIENAGEILDILSEAGLIVESDE